MPAREPKPVVLVAEDDPDIRDVLFAVLEDAGYRVVTANDGCAALEVADQEHPDIILVDAGMPHLDGAGFCLAYRQAGGEAPVVLVSAAHPEMIAATVKACGAASFIAKPFEIDHVIAVVENTIDGRSEDRA
jgi:DNA-binding response OmpR family regulator